MTECCYTDSKIFGCDILCRSTFLPEPDSKKTARYPANRNLNRILLSSTSLVKSKMSSGPQIRH